MSTPIENLKSYIAGEIVLSNNPADSLRKWRGIFKISKKEIALEMGISSSVITDYESGRVKSPGSGFIRRFVEALIEIDRRQGGKVTAQLLSTISSPIAYRDVVLDIHDFTVPCKCREIVKAVKGVVLANEEKLDELIYGYTVIRSLKAIKILSGYEFFMLAGKTTERALIFTQVSTGRSPMVAVKVSPLKPKMVVLHRPEKVDKLAVELALSDGILLVKSEIVDEGSLVKVLQEKFSNM